MSKANSKKNFFLLTVVVMFTVAILALAGCACSSSAGSASSGSSASTPAASDKSASASASSASAATVTVPNVVSLKQADAEKSIRSLGLALGDVKQESSDSVPAGSVIAQDPKAFASVQSGSKVSITVSSGKAAPKDVQVPDLRGMWQNDAEKALANAGLVGVASNPEESREVAPGQVFKQSVAAGSTVKEGTRIAFTTALAPTTVTVPDVVGMKTDDARKAITDAGFGFDTTSAYSDKVPEGSVISQSIPGGTQAKSGTNVTVTVSLGAKPASDVKVPDLSTFSWSDAEHALESAGLQARYTGDPAGVVVAQDVAAGTMVAPGTLVTVTLASAPEQVEVPNLVGNSVVSAEEETDKLGLGLDVVQGGNHGVVATQWPEAGTKVEKRTVIIITVDDSEFK